MSPLTLIVVIALGVAIGIAASPYIGTLFAAIGVVLLLIATLFASSILLRISVQQGVSLGANIKDGIRLYFRSIPKAWNMMIRPSEMGDGLSIRRRFDGLAVLFVCLVWALVVVGAILLFLFPT